MIIPRLKILVFLVLCAIPLSIIHAQPDLSQPLVSDADLWQIPFTTLGYEREFRLRGQTLQREILLPIPDGMQALRLRGSIIVSPEVASGTLEFRSGEGTLAALHLHEVTDTFEVPLQDAVVQNGVLQLLFSGHLQLSDDTCATAGTSWINISDVTLELSGTPGFPETVAEFFPSLLTQLTIGVPAEPTVAEAEAALRLSVAVSQHYGAQQPAIVVQNTEEIAENTPSLFERTIIVQEAADASNIQIETVNDRAVLYLRGSADVLRRPDELLGEALPLNNAASPTGEQVSLAELGMSELQAAGAGRLEVPITVSQSLLGGSINTLTFHLTGRFTPVTNDGNHRLLILINETIVQATPLTGSGEFDVTVDVPQQLLTRDNILTAHFEQTSERGCVADVNSHTAQIDTASTITFERGEGTTRGFLRFPQNLQPAFLVAFHPLTSASLQESSAVVGALQALSPVLLQPQVSSWEDAIASDLPVLFVTDGAADVRALNPLLHREPLRIVDDNGRELLRMESNADLSILQTFEQNGRDVLLLQYGAGQGRISAALQANPLGWYALQGDVLLQGDNQPPANLRLDDSVLEVQTLVQSEISWWEQYRLWIFVAALAAILVLLALAYPRVVRQRPT